jgi:hypothetical protein
MRAHLANAAFDVLHDGPYPIVSAFRGLPMARTLYSATVFSPYLSLVSWQRPEIMERRCVSCMAIPYEVREGSQS